MQRCLTCCRGANAHMLWLLCLARKKQPHAYRTKPYVKKPMKLLYDLIFGQGFE